MLSSTSHSYSNNKKKKNASDFSWCRRGSRRGKDCAIVIGVMDFVQIQVQKIAKTKRKIKDSFSLFWRGGKGCDMAGRTPPVDGQSTLFDGQTIREITCTIFDGQTSQPPPHQGRILYYKLQPTIQLQHHHAMVMVCIGIPRHSSHQTS